MNFHLTSYTLRVQQNGRKKKTFLEGLEEDLDVPYISKVLRRTLNCSTAVKKCKKTNRKVILLSGDMRYEVKQWLIQEKIARSDEIHIRG